MITNAKLYWILWLALLSIAVISYSSVKAYTYLTTTTLEDVVVQNQAYEKAKSDLQKARVEYCNDNTQSLKIDYDKCWEELNKSLNVEQSTTSGGVIPVPKWLSTLSKKNRDDGKSKISLIEENKFWKAYEVAINLIHKHEWLHLKAYFDFKGCSIWYWTRANSCNEIITREEADKRLGFIAKKLTGRVLGDFPTLPTEWQWAMVSFAFNCNKWYLDVLERWLGQHKFWCKKAWGKVLQGLVNRRNEEAHLILSK